MLFRPTGARSPINSSIRSHSGRASLRVSDDRKVRINDSNEQTERTKFSLWYTSIVLH